MGRPVIYVLVGKDVGVSAQRQRRFRLATTAAAVLSLVLWAVALTDPLLPRTGWEWSWEHPLRATVSGVAATMAAAAGVGLAIRAWRRPLRRPQRGLVFAIFRLAATAASALTFVRSGAWLSDMRIEIIDGTGRTLGSPRLFLGSGEKARESRCRTSCASGG